MGWDWITYNDQPKSFIQVVLTYMEEEGKENKFKSYGSKH
jgi:hypothetical protein